MHAAVLENDPKQIVYQWPERYIDVRFTEYASTTATHCFFKVVNNRKHSRSKVHRNDLYKPFTNDGSCGKSHKT